VHCFIPFDENILGSYLLLQHSFSLVAADVQANQNCQAHHQSGDDNLAVVHEGIIN
jgi:hypothetical protein